MLTPLTQPWEFSGIALTRSFYSSLFFIALSFSKKRSSCTNLALWSVNCTIPRRTSLEGNSHGAGRVCRGAASINQQIKENKTQVSKSHSNITSIWYHHRAPPHPPYHHHAFILTFFLLHVDNISSAIPQLTGFASFCHSLASNSKSSCAFGHRPLQVCRYLWAEPELRNWRNPPRRLSCTNSGVGCHAHSI